MSRAALIEDDVDVVDAPLTDQAIEALAVLLVDAAMDADRGTA